MAGRRGSKSKHSANGIKFQSSAAGQSPRSASTNNNYFTSALTNGPLTAPASGRTGGNGVSAYGSTSSFPTNSYQGSNYWVDVVFLSSGGGAGQPAIRRFVAYRRIADGK